MYSFDQQTGRLAWSHSTGNYVYAGAIAARTADTPPTVYFGSYDGTFYALDARTGEERWSQSRPRRDLGSGEPDRRHRLRRRPEDTSTYGFDVRNGHRVFQYPDGAYNPVISDGKEIFLTGYKTLYAMTAGDRARRQRDPPEAPKKPPAGRKKPKAGKKKG